MSQKTRDRRKRSIDKLVREIRELEIESLRCEGRSGYACKFGNYDIAPGCMAHWSSKKIYYSMLCRRFEKLSKRYS